MCGTLFGRNPTSNVVSPVATFSLYTLFDSTNEFNKFFVEQPSKYDICRVAKQIEGYSMMTQDKVLEPRVGAAALVSKTAPDEGHYLR